MTTRQRLGAAAFKVWEAGGDLVVVGGGAGKDGETKGGSSTCEEL